MRNKLLIITAILGCISLIGLGLFFTYTHFFLLNEPEIKPRFLADIPFDKEECIEDFEDVHSIVCDHFPFFSEKSISPEGLYLSFAERVRNVGSTFEYYDLLAEYFATLRVGHASLLGINNYTAMTVPRLIENELWIDEISPYLLTQGFQKGDKIVRIDHTSAQEWLMRQGKKSYASTDESRKNMAASWVFRSPQDSIRHYTVVRGRDTMEYTLSLSRFGQIETPEETLFDTRVINDSVAYIAINGMMKEPFERFQKEYLTLREKPYLVIDVRKNGGGDSEIGRKLCSYFVSAPHPHCLRHNQLIEPHPQGYKGQVFILIGNYTFSAAESFVLDMKEGTNAILVGEETGGDSGNGPRTFVSRRGTYFCIPTRPFAYSLLGFPLEGKGIPPHYYIRETADDFLKGVDTVLQYTLHQLIEKKEY